MPKIKSYKCDICPNKTFTSRQAKSRHMLTLHSSPTQKKSFNCNGCGRKFSRKENCERHKLTCKGAKDLVCKTYKKEFDRQYKLKRHQQIHKQHRHVCEFCSQSFKRSDHFEKHQQLLPCLNLNKPHVEMEEIVQTAADEENERESYSMGNFACGNTVNENQHTNQFDISDDINEVKLVSNVYFTQLRLESLPFCTPEMSNFGQVVKFPLPLL